MQCPVCKRPMISLELNEVEVDHCVACGGVWLDSGEMELLLDGAANRELLRELVEKIEARVVPNGVRRVIDVDPISTL